MSTNKRASGRGRLKKDWSLAAQKHYQQVRAEWAETQRQQQQERAQAGGGLASFLAGRPTPTNPQEDPPCPST